MVDYQTQKERLDVEEVLQYECDVKGREEIRCGGVVDFYVAKLLNL